MGDDTARPPDPDPSSPALAAAGITVQARDLTYCIPVTSTSTASPSASTDGRGGSLLARALHRLRRRQPRPKALLRHVSLTATPGRLLYIMGGSGAGKSTLLDLLAHRPRAWDSGGWMAGGVWYNGVEQRRAWRHVEPHAAYVRQASLWVVVVWVCCCGCAGVDGDREWLGRSIGGWTDRAMD